MLMFFGTLPMLMFFGTLPMLMFFGTLPMLMLTFRYTFPLNIEGKHCAGHTPAQCLPSICRLCVLLYEVSREVSVSSASRPGTLEAKSLGMSTSSLSSW